MLSDLPASSATKGIEFLAQSTALVILYVAGPRTY